MEFWGVEIKPGEPLAITPEETKLIHISQVSIGEVKNKKGSGSVVLRMKVDGQNFVLATLSMENAPQLMLDLVLDRSFELSHDWKDGSLYMFGYIADNQDEEDNPFVTDPEDDLTDIPENGKIGAMLAKANRDENEFPASTLDEDSDDMSDDAEDETDSSDDDDMDSEDEETPQKVEQVKTKRPESATKTPVSAKKAKPAAPQKTDGKKGGRDSATPHPSGKALPKGKKPQQSPKSNGQKFSGSNKKAKVGSK